MNYDADMMSESQEILRFLAAAVREMRHARQLFPDPDHLTLAHAEEAGEVTQAALNCFHAGPVDRALGLQKLKKELVQAVAMALRLGLEGDPDIKLPPCLASLAESREKRVYLSGPMKDMPEHNFPAFRAAAERLREWGYAVLDPSEIEHRADDDWGDLIARDFWHIALFAPTLIVLLPGWQESAGSRAELAYCRTALGLPAYLYRAGEATEKDSLLALESRRVADFDQGLPRGWNRWTPPELAGVAK